MSSFTAILDPQTHGTLHLPLPSDWLKHRVCVSAQREPIKSMPTEPESSLKGLGVCAAKSPCFQDLMIPLRILKNTSAEVKILLILVLFQVESNNPRPCGDAFHSSCV